jgi:hypothetical protein
MKSRLPGHLPHVSLLILGFATGASMVFLGLTARIVSVLPEEGLGAWFGVSFFHEMGFADDRVGWALVLLGVFWLSALSALWLRHSWGYWSVILAAIASMAFFPGGVVTAILVVAVITFSNLREEFFPRTVSSKQN